MRDRCKWDGCGEDSFEDWYYCEAHSKVILLTNSAFEGVIGR